MLVFRTRKPQWLEMELRYWNASFSRSKVEYASQISFISMLQSITYVDWVPPMLPIYLREPTEDEFLSYCKKIADKDTIQYEDKLQTRFNCCGHLKAGVTCKRYYCVHYTKTTIGHGDKAWKTAREALSTLKAIKTSFSHGKICGAPQKGSLVLIAFRVGFFWTFVANRLLYVDDSEGHYGKPVVSPCMSTCSTKHSPNSPIKRLALGWGTTRHHLLAGEELVAVEQKKNGEVTFEISSFSVPSHPLCFIFTPLTRIMQRRFAHEASTTVKQLIQNLS